MTLYKHDPTTLQLIPTKAKSNWKLLVALAVIFVSLGFGSAVHVNTVFERIPVVLTPKAEQCTDENVKAYIERLHLKFSKIVYQQVMLESGNLKSPAFRELHNLVGMQVSSGRQGPGKDVGQRFASYDNWKESLVDYAIWQAMYTGDIKTEEDYYYFLDKVYCEPTPGTPYSSRLKQIAYEPPRSP
jgi:hypothetical protein